MVYNNPLPRIDNILWLARLSLPFPATAGDIYEVAEMWRFNKSTLDFLRLFPTDEVFTSRENFLRRCEELELLLREERPATIDTILSLQD